MMSHCIDQVKSARIRDPLGDLTLLGPAPSEFRSTSTKILLPDEAVGEDKTALLRLMVTTRVSKPVASSCCSRGADHDIDLWGARHDASFGFKSLRYVPWVHQS